MSRSVIEAAKRGWDGLRRRVAMWRWDRPQVSSAGFEDRIVFVRWDAKLGDTIVLSWVFRELQRQRPDLQITVITAESFKELFVQGYGIDSVFVAGKRHDWAKLNEIARQIRHPRYVVHLSLRWRPRDIRFVRELAPEHVVGLDDELKLVDIKLGEQTRGLHFSQKLVPWLNQIGVDTTNQHYWIPRSAQASQQIDAWWPKLTPQARVIGLCPYGASKKRRLSDAQVIEIVSELLNETENYVLLIAQPDDLKHLQSVLDWQLWSERVLLRKTANFFSMFEFVSRCQAIVSVDTATVHLATGFSLPTLALYAPQRSDSENMRFWHPCSSKATTLIASAGESEAMGHFDKQEMVSALQRLFL